jgi:5-methyltetrahydrofolate--homocysteine methyltransferase
MRLINLWNDPPPLIVGERINVEGSRKIKRLLIERDYDGIVEVAREQIAAGARVLDVCVSSPDLVDEAGELASVVKRLATSVDVPLMIDSTDPAVIVRALEQIPGGAIVNSVSLDGGRARIDAIVPMAKAHGAAVVALTIDETGMGMTAARKLEIARRLYDIVVGEYGMAPRAVMVDALTFSLATGRRVWLDSARETIEGIRAIKRELPGVSTILGVSDVSFGLVPAARAVLNAVFLGHCVEAGLDAAIVNVMDARAIPDIDETLRQLADDLIWNRTADALPRFLSGFDALTTR